MERHWVWGLHSHRQPPAGSSHCVDMALRQRPRVSAALCTREKRVNLVLPAVEAGALQVAAMAETTAETTVEAVETVEVEPARGTVEEDLAFAD